MRSVWPYQWGVLQKLSLLEVSKILFQNVSNIIASFRVAGVALCDIPTCGRRNIFASISEDELQFLWQAQHFGDLHRHFAWQAQHFGRFSCCVFSANSNVSQAVAMCKFRRRRGILWHVR